MVGRLMKPRVVAAFPATGKSYLAARTPDAVDSDSSAFSWKYLGPDTRVRHPEWPSNYMAHIREIDDPDALVLVSSHTEVRDALESDGIPFTLVYPARDLRDEYRARMERRGSPPGLIAKVIDELWEDALTDCAAQSGCRHIELVAGQYLSDLDL